MKRSLLIGLLLGFGVFIAGCEELPPELEQDPPTIPLPSNVAAVLGVNQITLSWVPDPDFSYTAFAIYRSNDGQVTWSKVATVASSPYVDTNIAPGTTYAYQVAGVNENGIAGPRTQPVTVFAAIYAVFADDGAAFTNSRVINLTFTAPNTTQAVRFGETADLSGEAWRSYAPGFTFTLSAGDGNKTVYAQFLDVNGNTTESISDVIRLDTFSEISSLTYSPATIAPGGTLHFRIVTTGAEPNGSCEVFIEGMGSSPIPVFDDGVSGDVTAGDGIYELDYTFQISFRMATMRISAVFTDEAGNTSIEREFADDLVMSDPPAAVTLNPATDTDNTSISLEWTAVEGFNFSSYTIYRDTQANVNEDDSDLAGTVTRQNEPVFTDSGLDENTTYYYVVYVNNDLEESTPSNVRQVATTDINPTAVVLDNPSSISPTGLTLTWSENENTDFASYQIHQGTQAGVTDANTLVATITNQSTTFYDVTGLNTSSTTYYYRVYVVDQTGNKTRSNEVNSSP